MSTPPSTEVLSAFDAPSRHVLRYADIYQSDATTLWRRRVPIIDGNVSVDASRADRRNLDITLAVTDELPYGPDDGLWYDKIIMPYRGIEVYGDPDPVTGERSSFEWTAPLGVFVVERIERPRMPTTYQVTGRDFTKKLQSAKFATTTSWTTGTSYDTILNSIATNGGITLKNIRATGVTLSAPFIAERGSDRWNAIASLAESISYEAYFDALGYLIVRPWEDPVYATSYYTFKTGVGGNLVNYSTSTDDSLLYNSIVVHGDSESNALVWAQADNTNPDSPTRIARIGARTDIRPSVLVKDNTAALALAKKYLAVAALEQYNISIDSLVAPWLEAAEVVDVIPEDYGDGEPTRFLLTDFTIPLGLSTLSGTARRVHIVGT